MSDIVDLTDTKEYKTKYEIRDHLLELLNKIPLKDKEEVKRFIITSLRSTMDSAQTS